MSYEKQRASHRIKIIQGQMKKIEQMITDNRYCVDVMVQSLAAQKSLESLNRLLLAGHLKTCVISQIKEGENDKVVKELLQLYHLEHK